MWWIPDTATIKPFLSLFYPNTLIIWSLYFNPVFTTSLAGGPFYKLSLSLNDRNSVAFCSRDKWKLFWKEKKDKLHRSIECASCTTYSQVLLSEHRREELAPPTFTTPHSTILTVLLILNDLISLSFFFIIILNQHPTDSSVCLYDILLLLFS